MKSTRSRLNVALSLVCNLLIAVYTYNSVAGFFKVGGSGNMAVFGNACFRYFTVDSNILSGVIALFLVVCDVMMIAQGKTAVPKWLLSLKLMGANAVMLTFTVVMAWLGPISGYPAMIAGSNWYTHLVCPLLAMLSFCCFEHNSKLAFKNVFLGLLPVFIYGLVYVVEVVFITAQRGGWVDFYSLNMNGMWYISFPVILVVNLVLGMALYGLNQLFADRRK